MFEKLICRIRGHKYKKSVKSELLLDFLKGEDCLRCGYHYNYDTPLIPYKVWKTIIDKAPYPLFGEEVKNKCFFQK